MPDPQVTPATPFAIWAIVVMVLGWLLAIGTGLCGGTFVISGIADSSGYGGAMVMGGLIMGGVPCLVGIGMILAARKWGRRKPTVPSPDVLTSARLGVFLFGLAAVALAIAVLLGLDRLFTRPYDWHF